MGGGWVGSDRKGRLPGNWARLRAETLLRNPICVLCRVRPSTHCDHIEAKTDDHTRLQGVCEPCHLQKSGREGNAGKAAKPGRMRPAEQHPGLI